MFVVKTQILENYGAHSANGKFSNGNAYWKMKGGNEYIVNDVERPQDAMAFIAAKYMTNDLYYKEFPLEVVTWKEWQNELRISCFSSRTSNFSITSPDLKSS